MSATNGHVLGDVASFVRGITFTPNDVKLPFEEGTAVCMRTKNVQEDLDEDDLIAVSKDFVRREEQYLAEGDMLVSSANSWNLVGKCCWVPKLKYEATAGGFISILRADRKKVDPRYLYHWFAAPRTQHDVRLCGRQTTNISNLSYERCLNLPIPLPPLEEQKRIAAILDKADAIRRKRREARDICLSMPLAIYNDRFGNIINNDHSWEMIPLGDCGKLVSGGTPSKQVPAYWGGDFPWVSPKDMTLTYLDGAEDRITDKAFQDTTLKRIPPHSVLIVVRGMIMAHTVPMAMNDIPVAINQDMKAILPDDRFDAEFFLWTLKSMHGFVLSKVSTAAHGTKRLEVREIESLPIPLVPRKEQEAFIERISVVRRIYDQMANSYEDDLFNSLVQRAFKGEL